MTERIRRGGLRVAKVLDDLVVNRICPGTGMDGETFWTGFESIVRDLTPQNRALLETREDLQAKIDAWHESRRGEEHDSHAYKSFLQSIGYLVPAPSEFEVSTAGVDPEIASIAGPQLVVPVTNVRYALNAANARWGSLYDALYGSDAVSEENGCGRDGPYNVRRGEKVIAETARILDSILPLKGASHMDVTSWQLAGVDPVRVVAHVGGDDTTELEQATQFVGYAGEVPGEPSRLLFRQNGLHVELQIDRAHPIGSAHPAGVKDVILESAVTVIQDCEDSVAAVDAVDKAIAYGNWLGLMKGDLEVRFRKEGAEIHRELERDRNYESPDGGDIALPGRGLMLVRNVGLLMTTDAILDGDGNEIYEGILDAAVTCLCAVHDLKRTGPLVNSKAGSIYIVKPKMHGPDEVAFACELFDRVEDLLELKRHTVKIGIMDEERRTTLNLRACIRVARHRVAFINTGFLDRTGDEIHTSMVAGPMVPKGEMKEEKWLAAYEDANVDAGLGSGFPGHAQIGKGMWAKPDEMRQMLETKSEHPRAGADCAWVPSPTAATLHALHYHEINVAERKRALSTRAPADIDDILTLPLLGKRSLTQEEIQAELDNNAQGILGYVVRWVDQGVGCSTVPDINGTGLMEDRATCRISSQHMANWLFHGICSESQIRETMQRMAQVVDAQNAENPQYRPMAPRFEESVAFQAACELVLEGRAQPSGYTEPILHRYRKMAKRQEN